MEGNDVEKLRTLNALFDRVTGLPKLVNAFKSFVTANVADIVCNRLLTFNSNASLVLSFPASLSLTQDFRYALHDAFSNGFKKRHNRPGEMIAHHIDKLLRKGQGSSSDEVFNEQLDATLGLYRFTADKDVFCVFYHRALAKAAPTWP
ncbi:hypothetical protein BGW80DRAFT_1318809 [Lactifluus volemus]|nr:hypothetical protein BGW80DRAFT_1318809 [Lactifluus volemus]